MPLDVVRCRTLQATVWDSDRFQENIFLGAVSIQLEEIFPYNTSNVANHDAVVGVSSGVKFEKWYNLSNYHRMTLNR